MTPYFHYPTFDRRYRRFWSGLDPCAGVTSQNHMNPDPSFLALLLAVLYYGSVIEPLVLDPDSARQLDDTTNRADPIGSNSSLLLALGSRALGMTDFPNKANLSSLTAFMLLQMDQLRCQDTSACSFVAVSIRIAQSMGLHREDVNRDLDAISAEERRRIWALLVHLDLLTARRSGLSPILTQPTVKLGIPFSEVRDEFIGTLFANDPRHSYAVFILAHGRYEASACARAMLARQAEGCNISMSDIEDLLHSVRRLEQNLTGRISKIQSANTSNTMPFTAPGLVSVPADFCARFKIDSCAFSRWSQTTLRYITEQTYCDLYSLALSDISVWDELRDE